MSSAVLVNGNATEFFNPSRGIRQVDPLFPYIFILRLEYLFVAIHGNEGRGVGNRFLALVVAFR